MAAIPDEIIQRVRDAHDIVEVVSRSLELKRAGSAWKACCPFHEEKTPSFQVNPRLQIFKCFGCGKGGNVFHWLMETRGLTFPEAVRQLAEERSIEVPTVRGVDPGVSRDQRLRLRDALEAALSWFRRVLEAPVGAEARSYLERRGYDVERQRELELGFAPPAWDGLMQALSRRGATGEMLEEAGLARRRDRGGWYDAFRNRVMFPVRDAQGRLVTFAGRTLDPDEPAKYVNGAETALFHKSDVLYALDRAAHGIRRRGEALIMEGYTDVLMAHVHGFDHAVAGMGTAFTESQARLLGRFTERAVLLYDGDAAGQAASERTLEILLPAGFDVRVAVLPAGRDVDEILLEEGPEALEAVLGGARDWFAHRLERERERHDLSSARGRSDAAQSLLGTITKVKSEIERELRLKELAEELGGDLGGMDVEAMLRKLAARQSARPAPPRPAPPRATGSGGGARASGQASVLHDRQSQVGYLAGALSDAELAEAILRAVGPEEFGDAVLRRLYEALLDLHEAGRPLLRESLAAHLAQDAEGLSELAALPEDPTLAERVRSQIAFLEQRRLSREREAFLRAQMAAAAAGEPTRGRPSAAEPRSPASARRARGAEPELGGARRVSRDASAGGAAEEHETRSNRSERAAEDVSLGGGGRAGRDARAHSEVPPAEIPVCDEYDPAFDLPVLDGPPPEPLRGGEEGAADTGSA
ncbi:MAG: DNA primase [Planctomycetota bacterium]